VISRVRTALTALAVLSCSTLAAGSASAEESVSPRYARSYVSPQYFAMELRFSPYRPQIDDEPALNGKTPYANTFGSMRRLMVQLELDWQAFRIPYVGTIGPGLGVGYTNMSDKSFTQTGGRSDEDTSLDIFPMYLAAVLRADTFYRNAGIPIVPYAKAGLGMGIWRATNPGGTSDANGVRGEGKSLGLHGAIGISFALDALDPSAALQLDNATGINHTYVFVDYYVAALNGLAQSSALRVGTNSWAAGLAFEF